MFALFAVCGLIWMLQTGRWRAESWHLPTVYRGDAFEILARIKASSEGEVRPLLPQRIERLAAPYGADWSAYPTPEKIPLLLLGGIARLSDLFVAANLGLVLALGLNAVAFYWVVRRWLAVRWEWAMTGALLFAFNYAVFHRGLFHFSFVFTWIIPPGLLACWLIARSSRLQWRSPGAAVCLGAGVLLGAHNTYYLFFWLQLAGWALLAQWFGPRRPANLRIGLATVAVALVTFLAVNLEYFAYTGQADARPLLERNYGGTEHYALKPVEMFIPPAVHRVDGLAFLGQRYNRWSDWRGEEFLPYLGLAGITAVVWLLAATLPRLLRNQPPPGAALGAGWLIAFGSVGGVTNLLAFFGGLYVFRATNRVAIFIAAILLVFLAGRLSRCTARWPARWRISAALTLTGLGLFDQLPRPELPATREAIRAAVRSDHDFVRELESRLPAGAMVFQLPVLGFPEATPPWRLSDYEHFRPYLLSHTLRFSYGVPKFRPRGRWQQELQSLPPVELARRLEQFGFSALYLNRKGFEDGGDSLLRALAQAGFTRRIDSPLGNQVAILLQPAEKPRLPVARSLTFGSGWLNRPVDGVRWAYESATLLYYNPFSQARPARIRLHLRTMESRRVTLSRQATLVTVREVPAGDFDLDSGQLLLAPGLNQFRLDGGAALRAGPEANQLRSVGLIVSEVSGLDAEAEP